MITCVKCGSTRIEYDPRARSVMCRHCGQYAYLGNIGGRFTGPLPYDDPKPPDKRPVGHPVKKNGVAKVIEEKLWPGQRRAPGGEQ